ncbi:hypothetical protein [Bradyrhizobium cenepequi]|uniref:hypothetical protein n=1 Tax=Bradyrhizobium cenepequi TaxID=2821403 RepID=UPI001CE33A21|nr:hypothetical protein [Bradyrhizobium cenepequi]MCA6109787.1 hypothetical protein [Bradyrhizobium cenepequi]
MTFVTIDPDFRQMLPLLEMRFLVGESAKSGKAMKIAPQKSSRIRQGDMAERASPPKRHSLSASQKAVLNAALAGRLQLYPRGYATSKSGPFHSRRAVASLARTGLLTLSTTMRFATATERGRKIYSEQT